MEVKVGVYPDFDKAAGYVSLYDAGRVEFELRGVSQEDAKFFVKARKQSRPIYGSVGVATRDTKVEFTAHVEARPR